MMASPTFAWGFCFPKRSCHGYQLATNCRTTSRTLLLPLDQTHLVLPFLSQLDYRQHPHSYRYHLTSTYGTLVYGILWMLPSITALHHSPAPTMNAPLTGAVTSLPTPHVSAFLPRLSQLHSLAHLHLPRTWRWHRLCRRRQRLHSTYSH